MNLPIRSGRLNPRFVESYLETEEKIKALTENLNTMKAELLEAMQKHSIVEITNDAVKVKYIQPTTQERFDTKRFREEHEDLYNDYVKFVDVKPQLRITKK